MSDGKRSRAFYLPGTAVLSNVPGRIERFVTARIADRRLAGSPHREPTREFYLPATAVRSAVPGRLERFVSARLHDHRPREGVKRAAERVREFYLPATLRR